MEYKLLKEVDIAKYINSRTYVTFMVKDVSVRLQKDKVTRFIRFNMVDRDCIIEASLFNATDSQIEKIKDGKVFDAAIDVKEYDKSPSGLSCIIYNIIESELNPSQFVSWAPGMNEAQITINNGLKIIEGSIYKEIVFEIITKYWNQFTTWTAASSMHHNQLGGLYVHTAEVIDMCLNMADYWDNKYKNNIIDRALIVSSALLHDIGKCVELSVDSFGTTQYSIEASLESHIMIILKEVDITAYCKGIGYQRYSEDKTPLKTNEQVKKEQEAILLLKHCLAAHHGKLEYGSPIEPHIPEAYILNMTDEISAVMFRYNKKVKETNTCESSVNWLSGSMEVYYKSSDKDIESLKEEIKENTTGENTTENNIVAL